MPAFHIGRRAVTLLLAGALLPLELLHAATLDDMVALDAAYIPALSLTTSAQQNRQLGPQALVAVQQLQWQQRAVTLLLAGALLPLELLHAAALDDMVALDAAYIPALSLTSSAQQNRQLGPQALVAVQRLQTEWPLLRPRILQAMRGQSVALARVDRAIADGSAASTRSDWKAAHEALEHVRIELMAARRAVGIDYFVDRLTEFHEPMEELALAGSSLVAADLDAAKRARLELAFTRASVLWRQVEGNLPDLAAYAVTGNRANQFREAIASETRALSELSQALRGNDNAAILKAASAVKPPFARAFTAFGQPR